MAPRLLACFRRGSSSAARASHHSTSDSSVEEQRRFGPTLVELFSSQGCKASPEAEILATRLGRGDFGEGMPPVAVLNFHVEYWDYLGWKDLFGSSMWTVRQKAYVEALRLDTIYTPQAVINGSAQCLGTDEDALLLAVREASRHPSPSFQATFQQPSPDTLQISFTGQLRTKVDTKGVDIMVALYENGLVTDCTKGENNGRVLSSDYVVRRLEKLCSVKDVSAKKNVSGSTSFDLWEGFNLAKCGLLLFIQNSSLQTFGVQQIALPDAI